MFKETIQKSLFASLLCFTSLTFADNAAPEDCGDGPQPVRLGVRHIEGNGIGYNRGYTTFEGFFASDVNRWCVMPFLDTRAHVFDDGKWAANAGVGLRGIWGSRIYGINAYYDYRNTKHQHYNQIALGLETLGKWWDIRINGYLPVGDKDSPFYGEAKFGHFKGHNMFVRRKQQFAMKGADAEIGAHLNSSKVMPCYAAIGPYYYEGKGHNAYGGKFRVNAQYRDYIWLEGSVSYDNIFKDIYQGQIAFTLPLGKKTKIKPKSNINCSDLNNLKHLMVQRVNRNEIIPVDSRHKHFIARDSSTGDPLYFIFVSKNGHSDGSFNNPFSTYEEAFAAAAPGNIIYDTTGGTYTLTGPLTMQSNMKALSGAQGQELQTNFGSIFIPAMASQATTLMGASGATIFNVTNGSTISGFNLTVNGGTGITSTGTVKDVTISNNTLTLNGALGILLTNLDGTVNVTNNTINTDGSSFHPISLAANGTSPNMTVTGNTINGKSDSTIGIDLSLTSSTTTANISNNTINNINTALSISTIGGSLTASILNNTVDPTQFGISTTSSSNSVSNLTLSNNNVQSTVLAIEHVYLDTSTGTLNLKDNKMTLAQALSVSIFDNADITMTLNGSTAKETDALAISLDVNAPGGKLTVDSYLSNILTDTAGAASTVNFNNTSGGTFIVNKSKVAGNSPAPTFKGNIQLK